MPNRSLPLFLASTVNAFGAGMFYPFALLYYQKATDLSVGEIGTTLSSAIAIGLVANPLAGIAVDRIGARRPVVVSQLVEAIGFVGYLLVDSRLTLLVAAIVASAGSRIFYAAFSALIAEVSSGHATDVWYARTTVAQTVGGTVSGAAAALTIGTLGSAGFQLTIGVNIACLLLVAVLVVRIGTDTNSPAPQRADAGFRRVLGDRVFLMFVFGNFAIVTCTMFWGIGSIVYITEELGISLVASWVIGVAAATLTICGQTRLTRRIASDSRPRVLAIGCGMLALAFVVIWIAILPGPTVGFAIVAVGAAILALATMLYMPTARTLAVRLAPPGLTGRYVSTYELSWGAAAAALAPVAFGRGYDVTPGLPWLLGAAIASGVAAGFAIAQRRGRM